MANWLKGEFQSLKDVGDVVTVAKAYSKSEQMNWCFWISLQLLKNVNNGGYCKKSKRSD